MIEVTRVGRHGRVGRVAGPLVALWLTLTLGVVGLAAGQDQNLLYHSGQGVAPVFEGWELNADGSYTMYFGYFNRNWDEAPDVPIGAGNVLEPGGPDQGQPTHFLPRRNQFVFGVRVPKDWGPKELVWTLTVHGRTEKAYGSLALARAIDAVIKAVNNYGLGGAVDPALAYKNQAPVLTLEGDARRTVRVGEPLVLTAVARDDGVPKAAPNRGSRPPGRNTAIGLRVAWFRYRGAGRVTFDPPQFKVNEDPRSDSPWTEGWSNPPLSADGTVVVRATFSEPGLYVLNVLAHDGWLPTMKSVTVTVTPPTR